MAGYTRVDTSNNIADGNVISAADLDNEFDGVQAAFNASTGHNHDGTTGEGAPILVLGPAQDVVIGASTVTPKTTNTVDIGSSSLKFKDLYLAGNASIAGTLAVTGATTLSAALTYGGVTLSNAVTGTGNMVLSTSPTLVTPALGTPSSATLTNATGLPISTGVSGLGTGVATFLGTPSSANLAAAVTDETGSGALVFATSPTLVTPALGTPASATLTNATGLPLTSGVTGTLPTANGGTNLTSFTANGVVYASSSSALTTGSALTFDGSNFKLTGSDNNNLVYSANSNGTASIRMQSNAAGNYLVAVGPNPLYFDNGSASGFMSFAPASSTEGMRLTSTGLGLGTSSPAAKLDVSGGMRALSSAPSIPASGTGLEIYYASGTFTGTPSAYLISYDRTSAAYKPFNFDGSNYIFRTSGTASLTLNSSGNVGIGTSAPTSKLHVRSDADALTVIEQIQNRNAGASAGGVIAFINSTNDLADNRYAYIGAVTSGAAQNGNNLVFATNLNGGAPTERLRIDSSGNLGLGVTPSAWRSSDTVFQVGPVASLNSDTDLTTDVGYNYFYNSSNIPIYSTTAQASRYSQYLGAHRFFTAPSGTAGDAITFTQAMTLDASGNLLVGGTTNSGMATVQMSVGSTSTASSALQFLSTTSGSNGIYFGDGTSGTDRYRGYLEYNHTSDFMVFATAATERARITSGGYFKASFDGTYNSATGQFHEFVGNVANGYTVRTRCANASPANHYINEFVFSAASPNNTGALFIECRDSTAARFELRSNGGLANYSANDVNLSDRREKTNFAPAKSYLDTICAIPVQTFNYADQNMEDDPGLTLGVVAQDVQAVAPELVMESNWGTKDEPKMRLSIYQTDLQYALMKALQELKAEFDAYKASHP